MKLTPKQRVLRKYKGSYVSGNALYQINNGQMFPGPRVLGYGMTKRQAWADAAKRLK